MIKLITLGNIYPPVSLIQDECTFPTVSVGEEVGVRMGKQRVTVSLDNGFVVSISSYMF